MTALPQPPPRLLTVSDYADLPEDNDVRHELEEGVLVMAPRPIPLHQYCLRELMFQLRHQVPEGLELLSEVDIDLQLVGAHEPGFVRVPDLIVVTRDALARVREERGLLRASDVVLAVEIVSVGSRRKDHVVKHAEYADAGIPHYWVVDIEERVTLVAGHLAGTFGYVDTSPVTGVFTAEQPFPVHLDLDSLV
jgi:Uma2 family endonuclease